MGIWAGPFLIATLLLAAAGVAKAYDPATTAGALRQAGLPVPPAVVRVGGGLEAAVAVLAALTGATGAAAVVAVSYLAFTGFVLFALAKRVPIGSCGCFGKVDTPPSWLHVAVNLVAAGCATAVALRNDGGFASALADQPMLGVPFLVLVAVGVYGTYTVLTVVPQLSATEVRR